MNGNSDGSYCKAAESFGAKGGGPAVVYVLRV